MKGLYWWMTSSSGRPVHTQMTPRTPALRASSSGTGAKIPCQAGCGSAAA